MRRTLTLALTGLALLGLAACSPRPPEEPPAPKLVLSPADFGDLPGWRTDRHAEAIPAFVRSCDRLVRQPADRTLGPDGAMGAIADWIEPCRALKALPAGNDAAARAYFEQWFRPMLASDNGEAEGLFTGYYEASLRGSRTRKGPFQTPLRRRPADLVMVDLGEFRPSLKGERVAGRVVDGRLRPYEDRAAIEAGKLPEKGLELVWVDDPVDAFFLHIQGSGRVLMEDGTELRVGYDAQNGHSYFAIGRELVARGILSKEEVSMQSIRAWLEANPGEADAVMNKNPSYVFFRLLEGEGPIGAQGVPLTPGRSLAVDRSFVAYGTPLWLEAEDPLDGKASIRRLMVAQDTGGAIRGPVRGDVFWGHGPDAELRAGKMRSKGRYWLLIPRTAQPVG
ncbi:murein transglycosylase A [Indioceanicola profundi]|uniref:murein transglycosylase A n=1 Tax=Indioceanicola profundi TaxID=2220096 RepID=UPI000E6AAE37|nr:murein transglycosylase A [Indioceanicola profundi]